MARAFHETVACSLAECADRAAKESNIRTAALSGGCFANKLLKNRVATLLRNSGLDVIEHRCLPCGDGGVSFGQAVVLALKTTVKRFEEA